MCAARETGMATESACNPLTGEKINNRIKNISYYTGSVMGLERKKLEQGMRTGMIAGEEQFSALQETLEDRGTWCATVHGVANNWT